MSRKFSGGIWPVLQRELREGARRPANRRLRLGAAVGGIIVLWCVVSGSGKSSQELGSWLFASLHTLLLGLIAVVVPALAADGIAREKREGTLGLLFLTSLSARGIVAGKALAQALRAFTLWLVVLPILIIPFVLGGVTWFDVGCALSLEFSATVLCLAAGLLASSFARERNTAFVLSFLLGAIFLFLFIQFDTLALLIGQAGFYLTYYRAVSSDMMAIISGLDFQGMDAWSSLKTYSVALFHTWECLCVAGPILTLIVFRVVSRFAVRRIEHSWQDQIPSTRRLNLLRRYCTPLFQNRFRHRMQRSLDRNPIAWLQRYSWKARLAKWGLCLVFVLVELLFQRNHWVDWDLIQDTQVKLMFALAAVATFVGVGTFLQEKRSGALELILITPLSVNSIIMGRVQGLWKQFLPSALLIGIYFFLGEWLSHNRDNTSWVNFLVDSSVIIGAFLTLPVFTTYFALRVKNLFGAAFLSWVAMFTAPGFGALTMNTLAILGNHRDASNLELCFGILFGNLAFALLACFLLRHSLSRRIYSF